MVDVKQLYDILGNFYDQVTVQEIIKGMREKRFVSLRVNTLKSDVKKIKEVLIANNILYEEVSWYKDALIVKNKTEEDIRKLDIYKNGHIYLQSLSSMIPPLIMDIKEGESILDMAAAPGGKTTQMAALGENKVLITAIEKNKIRTERLKYNIEKLGAKKINVLNIDGRELDENFSFDKILLDAPCSGSGTLEIKDEKIVSEFSLELIDRSIRIEEQLLRKGLNILKPGQILVYSTCSILKWEDEEVIEKLKNEFNLEVVKIDEQIFQDIPKLPCNIPGAMLVKPSKYYEGFFVIKLRKVKN